MGNQISFHPTKKVAKKGEFLSAKETSSNPKLDEFMVTHGRSRERATKVFEKYPAIAETSLELKMRFVAQCCSEQSFQTAFRNAYEKKVEELKAYPKYELEIPSLFPEFLRKAPNLSADLIDRTDLERVYREAVQAVLKESDEGLVAASLKLWERYVVKLNEKWELYKDDPVIPNGSGKEKPRIVGNRKAMAEELAANGLLEFSYLSLTVWKSHLVFAEVNRISGGPRPNPNTMKIGLRKLRPDGKGHFPTMFKEIPLQSRTKPTKISTNSLFIKGLIQGIEAIEKKRGKGFVGKTFAEHRQMAHSQYSRRSGFNVFQDMMIKHSNDDYSIFITEKSLGDFPFKYGVLGRQDNTSYVLLKSQADKLVSLGGKSRDAFCHALGFDPLHLDSVKLYRIDIRFDYNKNPRQPNGLEQGANEFFQWGGFTSGGMRELIVDQMNFGPAEILGVYEVGRMT